MACPALARLAAFLPVSLQVSGCIHVFWKKYANL
jgi:hypothetical protein